MLVYPEIDPVFFTIGPLMVGWHGLLIAVGIGTAWWLGYLRSAHPQSTWEPNDVANLICFASLGLLIGARLGWIALHAREYLIYDPLLTLRIWEGGISFHGGLIGVALAALLFARLHERHFSDVLDFIAPLVGLGLFAGRIGNFLNGELWGQPTTGPWGFVVDPARLPQERGSALIGLCDPRNIDSCVLHLHATQLYEALLEGLFLFILLWLFTRKPRPRLAASGLFLVTYGVCRFAVEFIRLPDENLGYVFFDWVTMGQLLSLPMIILGIAFIVWAYCRGEDSGNYGPKRTPPTQQLPDMVSTDAHAA